MIIFSFDLTVFLRGSMVWYRYLYDHPEYSEAVQPSQFSFQIPKPLQENYVRKRPARLTASEDGNHVGISRPLEPSKGMYKKLIDMLKR